MDLSLITESEETRPRDTRGELDSRKLRAPSFLTSGCADLAAPPARDATEPLELESGLSGIDVLKLGGGSCENSGRMAGCAAGCRTLLAGELGRDIAAVLDDGIGVALLTDDDLVTVMGGFVVRVGVAGLLTGVVALPKELTGRVGAVADCTAEFPGRVDVVME